VGLNVRQLPILSGPQRVASVVITSKLVMPVDPGHPL
jgi:hypothetical protein